MSVPLRVRLPPHTLRVTTVGRMVCSVRQLVASIDGSHRRRNTAGSSLARCLAKRFGRGQQRGAVSIRGPSRATEPGDQSAAGRRQTVLADVARVAAVPHRGRL